MTTTADRFRLEIDTTPVPNLQINHSGQDGNSNGYTLFADTNAALSAVSTATGHYLNAYALRLSERTSSGGIILNTNLMSCIGKARVNATFKISTNTTDSVLVQLQGGFYNAAGGFIVGSSFNTELGNITSTDGIKTYTGPGYAVPAGAVSFALTFLPTRYNAGTLPRPATAVHLISTVKVAAGTAAEVNTLTFSEPTWTDLLPTALNVNTTSGGDMRGVTEELTSGTMTATLTDPAVDPATNSLMRQGRAVRVRTKVPSAASWVNLWSGTISTLDTTYGLNTRITIVATDALTALAKYAQPLAYGGSLNQRVGKVVNGSGVSYATTDTAGSGSMSTPISQDESATALDQLSRTRNAFGAYAWVDRNGVVQVAAPGSLPTTPTVYFRDTTGTVSGTFPVDYLSDVDVSFGSKALVNSVTVVRTNRDESLDDGAKTYGPYRNVASVGSWGEITDTVDVNDGVPATLAAGWLTAFANPVVFPNELSFDALRNTDANNAAIALGLFDRARVKFKSTLNGDYRVLSIEHVVRPESWLVKVRFRPIEATAAVTVTNPPGGASAGPADVLAPDPGPLAARYRSSNFSLTTGAVTTVPFDSQDVADGITWDGTNNRFTAPRAGRYLVSTGISFGGNSTGNRLVFVNVNGTSRARLGGVTQSANQVQIAGAATVKCAAADVISITAQQTSGGALVIAASAARESYVSVTYLGP